MSHPLLDYASPDTPRWFDVRRLLRVLVTVCVGSALGATAGWLVSPAPVYSCRSLLQLFVPKPSLSLDEPLRAQLDASYQRDRQTVLSLLRDPALPDEVAADPALQTTGARLRSRLTVEDVSRTELVAVMIKGTNPVESRQLSLAVARAACERAQAVGVVGLRVLQGGFYDAPPNDLRLSFSLTGGAIGATMLPVASWHIRRRRAA
jgi:capsular polysaccharide biosynthesis protein